ncbi:dynein regulatory complex protein 9-like [Agrilus planipennis]|uniref:Dynein regulatory complex protein 9-like n=1 Tax=Agrilus planipennis TaxID=224129 RepID=A0A1W4XDR2_AGRPL|nr:dynein regulatory complex protein 9-like [Agrilus planipennis]
MPLGKQSAVYSEEFLVMDDNFNLSVSSISQSGKNSEVSESFINNEPVYVLPRLMAMAFACVLDEAAKKLSLILNFDGIPKIESNKTADEVTEGEEVVFDHKTLKPIQEMLEYEKIIKFQRDVYFVKKTLDETTKSLLETNSFDYLVTEVSEYKHKRDERNDLLKELEQYKQEIAEFKRKSEEETRLSVVDFQNLRREAMKIGEEIMQDTLTKNAKMRYVSKWQASRQELNYTILINDETKLRNIINTMEREMERENRVHDEIEKFINEQQKEYEEQIDEWIRRYDTEMEQLDLDISVTNEKIEDQEKKNAEIKNKYEERQRFIEEWLEYREKKRLERERYERIFEAAMTIQCWWRTVMIKKKLGPYGKKKKGKGKKK